MTHGHGDGCQSEQQLGEQQQQDRDVAKRRSGADAYIEKAAMREQRYADQAEDAGNAANNDGHPLLEAVADTNQVKQPDGVSNPTRWPRKITSMPTWNKFEPHISWRRRSSWLDPDFQVYCSRS